MNDKHNLLVVTIIAVVLGLACGGEQPATNQTTAGYLAASYDAIGVGRSSPPRTFIGQNLWEYINGGAELYHTYGFIEVATADYRKGETEMVVDLYRFDSTVNAFGLYSMLRPDDADLAKFGVEGHVSPSKIEFVKGDLLVRVIGFDESDETGLALINLADEINKQLPGGTTLPPAFGLFPSNNAIKGSTRYYAEAFLGQSFLARVYCQDYLLDTNRVTLFLCEGAGGVKLLEWSGLAEEMGALGSAPDGLSFDVGKAFIVDNSFYGQVVVGLRAGRMVGMVGYVDECQSFVSGWLESIE